MPDWAEQLRLARTRQDLYTAWQGVLADGAWTHDLAELYARRNGEFERDRQFRENARNRSDRVGRP